MDDIIIDRAFLGLNVNAKNGEIIGNLSPIFINPEKLSVKAIQVDKGLLNYDHYIDREYTERLGSDSIVLNITPLEKMVVKMIHKKFLKVLEQQERL